MNHKNRGIALIISFKRDDFDNSFLINNGFTADTNRLKKTFKNLGFEVHYYSSLNKSNFEEIIEAYSERDFTDDDCFVCATLGHGDITENVFCADGGGYPAENLYKVFGEVVSLQKKPKVFINNSCRGDRFVGIGKIPSERNLRTGKVEIDDNWGLYPPKDLGDPNDISKDIFKFFGTIRGYYATGTQNGSLAIIELCDQLDKDGTKKSLVEIFTKVQAEVGRKINYNNRININQNYYSVNTVIDQSNTGRKNVVFYKK